MTGEIGPIGRAGEVGLAQARPEPTRITLATIEAGLDALRSSLVGELDRADTINVVLHGETPPARPEEAPDLISEGGLVARIHNLVMFMAGDVASLTSKLNRIGEGLE